MEYRDHGRKPRIRLSLLLPLLTLLSSGCSHVCHTETFHKPSAPKSSGVNTNSISPSIARFSVKETTFSVAICNKQHIESPKNSASICIAIELDPSDSLQFSRPELTLILPGNSRRTIPIGEITYQIFCPPSRTGPQCSSSLEAPTSPAPQQLETYGYIKEYSFSATLEFKGASDTQYQGALFGHRFLGKRLYHARTHVESFNDAPELTLQLPILLLNGKPISPPELRYHLVTEKLCRTIVLQ